ncbi:hypothetical protein H310_08790 [Aphanomyces invadans]|uniref:Protein phosphatase n=1 Tax=Aphanomyces invadans TaxID=157072 RepID=A0A024TZ95_9STRA|nr:hypothetical protein H310_08790 [Aphanomyces invadans]ETV98687.1 hypothetical protein H310_08790 [Aphanomyces invadans]|eukprot:XP_008872884.1 hypothetical protein H310_08790 [Aphanomyces invadans]
MLARHLGPRATASLTKAAPRRHFSASRGAARSSPSASARREFDAFIFDAHASCKGKRCTMDAFARPEGCGEDSFFVSPTIVGVADGVGGWNENGVDPSAISRAMMRYSRQLVQGYEGDPAMLSTLDILTEAYALTLKDDAVEAGSTTACIIKIRAGKDGEPMLDYTNLGDSGFAIVRGDKVVFRSSFQSMGLAPFQLAKIPERFKCYGAMESQPSEANNGTVALEDGDIIVLATDGVWDNFAQDLQEIPPFFPPVISWRRYWHGRIDSLVSVVSSCNSTKEAADAVVEASLSHNLKPDDVTVIVAKVSVKPKAKL